jgi:ribosome recycling factor
MSDEYLDGMKDDFAGTVQRFEKDLATVRTGRASPTMLNGVQVMVASYGASMPLNQLATVTAPDARLLVVNPWDKGTIGDIEKGIVMANLGLNPANDGQIIRVPIPALTQERRKEMVRQVRKLTEDARIRARKVRREYMDIYKELETDKEISEDDLKRYEGVIQKATDECVTQLDGLAKAKEDEVLEG